MRDGETFRGREMFSMIKSEAERELDYAVSLRRYFHSHPELSRGEAGTQARIIEELSKIGIKCEKIAETGVICSVSGTKKGKTIVLRADIDALPIEEKSDKPYRSQNPGRMHACGHDVHAASLVTALKILFRHREQLCGTVVAVFQPGEEDGYGGVLCAADERVKRADRVFGLHVAPDLPAGTVAAVSGPIMASVDMYRIEVTGRQSHISQPQNGVDAALIAAEILISLKNIPSGLSDPRESVLVGIGSIHAGTSYNIIAGSAYLDGTIRAFNEKERAKAKANLEKIARLTAEKYGGEAKVVYDGPSPAVINDEGVTEDVCRAARELFGTERVVTEREKSYGGDDFSFFQQAAPGTYALIGSSDKSRPETCVPVHNERFDVDESALVTGAALYAGVALDYLR